LADYQHDYVTPLDLLVDRLDETALGAVAGRLRHAAENQADRERLSPASLRLEFSLDLRYAGQGHALNVPWNGRSMQDSLAAFNVAHWRLYGYGRPHHPVESVAARLRAIAPVPPVMPAPPIPENVDPGRAVIARSEVAVGGGIRSVSVYDREWLGAGARLVGPAIVEQEDTTVYLGPHPASIDSYGNLIIDTMSSAEAT
jgi:N-methylhydantoinase A